MNRRGFLAGILAAGVAPALVRSPMRIWVPATPEIAMIPFQGGDVSGLSRIVAEQKRLVEQLTCQPIITYDMGSSDLTAIATWKIWSRKPPFHGLRMIELLDVRLVTPPG